MYLVFILTPSYFASLPGVIPADEGTLPEEQSVVTLGREIRSGEIARMNTPYFLDV